MCPALTTFSCAATVPPTLGSYCFYNSNQSNATLYVPAASMTAYSAAAQWSDFGNMADIATGVTMTAAEAVQTPIYDLQGRCVAHPMPGNIYISGSRTVIER